MLKKNLAININKAHYPVTVLGPGRRIGIWLQGCAIGCKGCVSQDTWDANVNRIMSVDQLLAWCKQVVSSDKLSFDGVTISGGEPFDQPEALSALLDALNIWRNTLKNPPASNFDVLCYSGYPLTILQKKYPTILAKLDALIPEPYIDTKPTKQLWRGSENQSLQLLTNRAQIKYATFVEQTPAQPNKHIQVMLDGQKVWYIGIPQRGDMQALEARCQEQGIEFTQASWRT